MPTHDFPSVVLASHDCRDRSATKWRYDRDLTATRYQRPQVNSLYGKCLVHTCGAVGPVRNWPGQAFECVVKRVSATVHEP